MREAAEVALKVHAASGRVKIFSAASPDFRSVALAVDVGRSFRSYEPVFAGTGNQPLIRQRRLPDRPISLEIPDWAVHTRNLGLP